MRQGEPGSPHRLECALCCRAPLGCLPTHIPSCPRSAIHRRDKALLQRLGIRYVVNCAHLQVDSYYEGQKVGPSGGIFQYCSLDERDDQKSDLRQHFGRTNAFLANAMRSGPGNCLIHCVAGVSRSTSILTAFLMMYNGWQLRDCLAYIKMRRCITGPNNNFRLQLAKYVRVACSVCGVCGVCGMVPMPRTDNLRYRHNASCVRCRYEVELFGGSSVAERAPSTWNFYEWNHEKNRVSSLHRHKQGFGRILCPPKPPPRPGMKQLPS